MTLPIYCFDPTVSDIQSKVRGIGRYLQILRENFSKEWQFINNLKIVPFDSVFINPFFNLFQPPLFYKRIAKKQIAVIHDLIPLKYPKHYPIGIKGNIYVYINKLLLKNYDLIITDSETSKKDIKTILNIPDDKIKVIYPTLPKVFLNPKSEYRNPKQFSNEINPKRLKNSDLEHSDLFRNSSFDIRVLGYCLYVGDATWNKNLVNLAKAIKVANIQCVFVGKVFENFVSSDINHPWQKELKEFLELVQNDNRFIFPGFISDEELITLYQNALCNILVSRDEGYGFSFVEAASQECPSILSDIPIFHEIAQDGALFINHKNPEEIAKEIKNININNTLRQELRKKAKKRSEFFASEFFRKNFKAVLG
jgi:glycosyltransferase involved in cell wall biosynthesis